MPGTYRGQAIVAGTVVYLVGCRVLRHLLVRDHTRGIRAYREGRFRDAIAHFDASHRFYSAHPRLDASRSIVFGVASRHSYGIIALGNMAYCHGQLGEVAEAAELYERVLKDTPDHTGATASVNRLRTATAPADET